MTRPGYQGQRARPTCSLYSLVRHHPYYTNIKMTIIVGYSSARGCGWEGERWWNSGFSIYPGTRSTGDCLRLIWIYFASLSTVRPDTDAAATSPRLHGLSCSFRCLWAWVRRNCNWLERAPGALNALPMLGERGVAPMLFGPFIPGGAMDGDRFKQIAAVKHSRSGQNTAPVFYQKLR